LSQTAYGRVTPEIEHALRRIVGEKNVLTKEAAADYAKDETPDLKPVSPDLVVKPVTVAEVAEVMRLATRERIPVTPRGAGTGLSGGAVPVLGGIVLSFQRMNRIPEIDTDNFTATVEPGVVLSDLHKAVEAQGLYYPLYPGEMSATIGGNVSTNAGGMRAVKYGVTRHFVIGLEAVLPSGEIIETGGKYVKCSTAYDLTQLIVGSEGTLAVVTKIILRLIPPPGERAVVLVPFNSLDDAINAVPQILKERVLPVGIEFLEKDVVRLTEEFRGGQIPIHDYEASLMIIVEADTEEEGYKIATLIGETCMTRGAVDVFVASGERAKDLMAFREKAWPAIVHAGHAEMADVVVPRSRIADFVRQARQASEDLAITTYMVGHAGDGNIHLAPILPDTEDGMHRMERLFRRFYEIGAGMGGTISGEHGIGSAKKGYLDIAFGKEKLELMRRIKKAFDPNNIMNPGKIFDL